MTEDPRLAELTALSTEELRVRAFAQGRQRHDVGFFWSLFTHLPAADDAEAVDGSTGSFGAGIDDAVALWEEWTHHDYGEQEPLVRAAFIDYLIKHP